MAEVWNAMRVWTWCWPSARMTGRARALACTGDGDFRQQHGGDGQHSWREPNGAGRGGGKRADDVHLHAELLLALWHWCRHCAASTLALALALCC
eukprot:358344-Chlamydomonas_euryale.AAC.10